MHTVEAARGHGSLAGTGRATASGVLQQRPSTTPPLLHSAADGPDSRRSLSAYGRRAGGEPMATIRPADGAGVRIGFAHEHPQVAGESARMRCNPRHHVADLVDPRPEQLERLERRPVGGRSSPDQHSGGEHWPLTAAPAQREEARRQLGRPLSRPGSRRATGSTARQTWRRVLDSCRHRPSRPSGVPRDS